MTELPTDTHGINSLEKQRRFIHDMGLGELKPDEVESRFSFLKNQVKIGLERIGEPTREDGGLLAIRTGIPIIKPEVWEQITPGSKAFVADIAGTNWNVMQATKAEDGNVVLDETSKKTYFNDQREVTYDDFVGRIAYPIAGEIRNNQEQDDFVDIGLSLGFPHINTKTDMGMEAKLVDVKDDGSMAKEWKITDWDPKKHGDITGALREKLQSLGIKVRTLVAINDTPAVALDGGAAKAAHDAGLEVIPAGFVGGTGTNGAVDNNGLVNLEIGHAKWPEDEVFKKMKQNGWIKTDEAELEPETGMYLAYRLAAGMQLLKEKDNSFEPDENLISELISNDPDKDQAIVSRIANGEKDVSPEIQGLAKDVLKRAGQVYGMMIASTSEVAGGDSTKVRALLAEGGTLLKGYSIKDEAEKTAAALGQPIKIIEAKGLKGVGALAMAYPHIAR